MKPRLAIFAFVALGLAFAYRAIAAGKANQAAIDVSLVELIANPEKYDKKVVRAIGFLHLEFEGNALYLHREDYEHGLSRNGFWIDIGRALLPEATKLSDRYVLIEGIFSAEDRGHLGLWAGALVKVDRVTPWR